MIDSTSQLVALLRAQFGAQLRAEQHRSNARTRGRAQRDEPLTQESSSRSVETRRTNEQQVALRVRALSPEDPQRERKAFRIFLEAVLMQAFDGRRLYGEDFDRLVDEVLHRMESDAALDAELRHAGALLLPEAASGRAAATP